MDSRKTSKPTEKLLQLLTVKFLLHPTVPLGSQEMLKYCPEQKWIDALTQQVLNWYPLEKLLDQAQEVFLWFFLDCSVIYPLET